MTKEPEDLLKLQYLTWIRSVQGAEKILCVNSMNSSVRCFASAGLHCLKSAITSVCFVDVCHH